MPACRRIVAIAGALTLAVGLPACGDDDGDEEGADAVAPTPDAEALLDYVPADPSGIRLVDLAAAREELGLPADADASEPGGSDADSHLGAAASAVIPYLSLPRPRPVQDAIDHGAITAAAGNLVDGPPGVAALATPQPFEDIAGRLVTEGYKREGDVLSSDSSFVAGSYSVIADAGGGVIVLGFRPATVAQAIEDAPGTDNPARPLIEDVEGVTRGAAVQDSPECIAGIAIGQSADIETGEIRIEVEGEASPQRFRLPDAISLPEYDFGGAEAQGDVLVAEVGVDPQSGSVNGPVDILSGDLLMNEIYEC